MALQVLILLRAVWFGASYVNLRWPCIFKHQI